MADANRPLDVPHYLSQRGHRVLIGVLGFLLPLLLPLVARMRPTDGLDSHSILPSVSAYYYTGAVGIFVGVVFALSLFLFTYQGYKGVLADRVVGLVAGAAALCVALFPAEAPGLLPPPDWWSCRDGTIHYASAITLFGCFILFSVWLFRKSNIPRRRDRPPDKRLRDDLCLLCGLVMIVCVGWAIAAGQANRPIFYPEAGAIMAFAVSL